MAVSEPDSVGGSLDASYRQPSAGRDGDPGEHEQKALATLQRQLVDGVIVGVVVLALPAALSTSLLFERFGEGWNVHLNWALYALLVGLLALRRRLPARVRVMFLLAALLAVAAADLGRSTTTGRASCASSTSTAWPSSPSSPCASE